MKCPWCDVEMIHGYLIADKALWSDKRHTFSLLPRRGERWTLRLGPKFFAPNHVESDCCPRCRRIVLSAEYYDGNLGE